MSVDDRHWNLTEDQEELRLRARQLAVEVVAPRAAEVDRTEAYPWDVVEALQEAGYMGMTVPEAYGGPGRSFLEAVLVVEEMARQCGVTGRIAVEANMGALSAIMAYGTEDQKRLAAELVLGGDKPAICITEPGAGSAASQMTTRADRRGDRYVLNGKKHWITGGGVSRLHLVFARGFAELMNAYNTQRVGAATVALGLAAGAHDRSVAYVKEREQFGRPIAEFQGVQWMLADMATRLEAARSLIWRATTSRGPGGSLFPDPTMAAQAKIFTSETCIDVANDALQLFGAAGYSRNNPMERICRDVRMFTIGGGTAQILRTVVASRVLDMKLPQRRGGFLPQ